MGGGPGGAPARTLSGAREPLAGVVPVQGPGWRTLPIMRVLMSNACSFSWGYCQMRAGRKVGRAALSPEEVADAFMALNRRGLASGFFLTSGIPGSPGRMMDQMLAAAEWLRRRHGYRGYLHLKLLPTAEPVQVEAAARLASRLSVNLEAPDDRYLATLPAGRPRSASGTISSPSCAGPARSNCGSSRLRRVPPARHGGPTRPPAPSGEAAVRGFPSVDCP